MSPTFRVFLSISAVKTPFFRGIDLAQNITLPPAYDEASRSLAKAAAMSPNQLPNAPIDKEDRSEDYQTMDSRISALEKDVAVLKTDVAVIRSNYVTKEDLQRELHAVTWRIIGAIALMNAATFFLARTPMSYPPPIPQQTAAPAAQPAEQPKAAAPTSR